MQIGSCNVHCFHGSITNAKVEAIVTPNSPYSGTGQAVYNAAGNDLYAEVSKHRLETSQAIATSACNLKDKGVQWIIHTSLPLVERKRDNGLTDETVHRLKDCYVNALMQADNQGAKSIAFAALAVGPLGLETSEAVTIALDAIKDFFDCYQSLLAQCTTSSSSNSSIRTPSITEIQFHLFDQDSFNIYQSVLASFNDAAACDTTPRLIEKKDSSSTSFSIGDALIEDADEKEQELVNNHKKEAPAERIYQFFAESNDEKDQPKANPAAHSFGDRRFTFLNASAHPMNDLFKTIFQDKDRAPSSDPDSIGQMFVELLSNKTITITTTTVTSTTITIGEKDKSKDKETPPTSTV